MDLLLGRPAAEFWNPNKGDRPPVCTPGSAQDVPVPADAHPYAPERFVPYGALVGPCPAEVDAYAAPERPLAASRAQLAAAWSRLADGIVIITLREAADRRARLAEELRLGGIVPENADRTLWYLADRPRADFPGNRGRFGCMRSHVAVTVEAERRGWRRWVVLEDDAFFAAELGAGILHNAADALDAAPGMPLLALGTSHAVCDDGGAGARRSVFPVRFASGTTCFVATPNLSEALRPYREAFAEERDEVLIHGFYAADAVLFNTSLLTPWGGAHQALPNVVAQSGQTQIGYSSLGPSAVGSWIIRKASLAEALRRASDPRLRRAARTAATLSAAATAALVALAAAAVLGAMAVAKRLKKGNEGLRAERRSPTIGPAPRPAGRRQR
jgi:hypothetical protein